MRESESSLDERSFIYSCRLPMNLAHLHLFARQLELGAEEHRPRMCFVFETLCL